MSAKLRLPQRKICRLSYWHYSKRKAFFITILTASRWRFLGEMVEKEMKLSVAGEIAKKIWEEIPVHFPYITLDEFVLMPDHMHGILIINEKILNAKDREYSGKEGGITKIHNPMLHDNISKVIRWFKGRSTFEIRKGLKDFKWHGRFHDRILRKSELSIFRQYIQSNPDDWQRWL